MNYVLQIDLLGADKAEEILKRLSGARKSMSSSSGGGLAKSVSDDAAKLDAYWKKLEKVDKLAKSLVSGTWTYSASPIKKMADDSERLAKWLQKASGPGSGLDKLGKSLLFGAWSYTPGVATSAEQRAAELADWKKRMAAVVPNVHIAGQSTRTPWNVNPFQAETDAFGAGGLATAGQELPKTAEEIQAFHEQKIAREATEARRKDLMEADAKRATTDRAKFYKDLTFLMMPAMNPGSVWASLFSTRQTFSAMMTNAGQGAIGKFGLSGIGGSALATGLLVGAATAVGVAFMGLKAIVEQVSKAYERASLIYSKALQSGLGLGLTTRRSMLASIIGVSEQDVFRFGSQMAYLNPKLEQATSILAATAPALTQTSWNAKILKADFESLFSLMANDLNPAVNNFVAGVDALVKSLVKHYNELMLIYAMTNPGVVLGLKALEALQKKYDSADPSKMPAAQSWMKQLPASHWEHMGLVMMGGAQNFAKETAKNTRDAAMSLRKLVSGMTHPGVFRNSWNMSKTTNSP